MSRWKGAVRDLIAGECEDRMVEVKHKGLTDGVLLALYRQWSEELYCCGFLMPSAEFIREFREWLPTALHQQPLECYEREFLQEFKRQEAE